MDPRLRGDDNGESLLHIFESGNPAICCLGPRLRGHERGSYEEGLITTMAPGGTMFERYLPKHKVGVLLPR